MKINRIHDWNLKPKQAIALQKQLSTQILVEDRFSTPAYVAGVDVGFEDQGRTARAAVVVLEYQSLILVENSVERLPVEFPYIPGLLSFREIPVILKALENIRTEPDIILCDGQGIAHPRRFGIASHLGLILDISTIGVGKTRLVGTHGSVPDGRGDWTPLIDRDEEVGVVLRTRPGVRPLYISPGHKVTAASSVDIVMGCTTRFRLPETTRYAHRLASG